MTFKTQYLVALAGLGLLAMVSQTASAAFVECPGTEQTSDREFGVQMTTPDSNTPATCLTTGPGNLGGSDADFPGWTFLEKVPDSKNSGALINSLTITGVDATSGTFSINAPGWTNFIIVFKSGGGQADPDWAAFNIPNGYTGGDWRIISPGQGSQSLSHANLYGKQAVVPIPAAVWLFGSALLGIAGVGYRRKQST